MLQHALLLLKEERTENRVLTDKPVQVNENLNTDPNSLQVVVLSSQYFPRSVLEFRYKLIEEVKETHKA